MSDDPQQAPNKFADEEPYSDENNDADTAPAAPGDSDTEAGDTDQHSDADA
jgi:hypothetical protein